MADNFDDINDPNDPEKSQEAASESKGMKKLTIVILVVSIIFIIVSSGILIWKLQVEQIERQPPNKNPPLVADNERIDCVPETHIANYSYAKLKEKCEARGCVWAETGIVKCYADPASPFGAQYEVENEPEETATGVKVLLKQKAASNRLKRAYDPVKEVQFEVTYMSANALRFRFIDPNNKRFEVPKQIVDIEVSPYNGIDRLYDVKVETEPFSFRITRKDTGTVLWNTDVGGFVFSDQFLSLSTRLPSKNIYGFGENNHESFRHDLNHTTWGMFARDNWVDNIGEKPLNHYGVHPFYTCLEDDGNSHGVLLLNSNAQDYTFTPLPMLTYRTIGGVLDFYMFVGPEPEQVVQQYHEAIGYPYMPPYWALGFQLCRYGYNDLETMKAAVQRTIDADIPLDIQYADIDHYDERKVFTIDGENYDGLKEFFSGLRQNGMHTIIILDPCLIANETNYEPYDVMMENLSVITWPNKEEMPVEDFEETNTTAMLGFVWPKGKVIFPDFLRPDAEDTWKRLIVNHSSEIDFDGLWIDMNEPANFGTNEEKPWNWPNDAQPYWSLKCPVSELDDPDYSTMATYAHGPEEVNMRLSSKTLCMVGKQGLDRNINHYDAHSIYGASQIQSTLTALRQVHEGKRGIVVSRSTFPGSGHISGHWLGDNFAQWNQMHHSIIGMLEFNLFGFPYIGADICGFFGNTTAPLCKRWMQLGAFYPYSRNHNDANSRLEQDPANLGEDVAKASREALRVRYTLLPYLYTLFHQASTEGGTVVRPLHHEYPRDAETFGIDKQFLWGPAILFSPILEENATDLEYYLPAGRWTNYYDDVTIVNSDKGDTQKMDVNDDTPVQIHIRGGHIIPLQDPANNTVYSRKNDFHLRVHLDKSEKAEGKLFWDDGDSLDTYKNGEYFLASYTSDQGMLTAKILHCCDKDSEIASLFLRNVYIHGVAAKPGGVTMNETNTYGDFQYDASKKVLKIYNIYWPMNDGFILKWKSVTTSPPPTEPRINCLPEWGNPLQCAAKDCIWDTNNFGSNIPRCYINSTNYGYTVQSDTEADASRTVVLTRDGATSSIGFGPDIETINLMIEQYGDKLVRLKIYDPNEERYEVPINLNLPESKVSSAYTVNVTDTGARPFGFKIERSSGTTIWDTTLGGLTFADQYLQLITKVTSDKIYGFGEHRHFSFKHDMEYKTWPMFSRDQAPGWGNYANLYGVHPYYMCIEDDIGNSHGVLLLNSNAMEIQTLPLPGLKYMTLGGVLDFYFVFGDSPEDVSMEYQELIGKPYFPSYWALGFHLCRYGYNTLEKLQEAVNRTIEAEIPLDVQYADIDTFEDNKDFTYDKERFAGLPEYFSYLQDIGMHTIIILDPAIGTGDEDYLPYVRGRDQDAYIRWPEGFDHQDIERFNSSILHGYVWPLTPSVFPDYFSEAAQQWWMDEIITYSSIMPFDGLWIDMNEPANFGTNEERPWNWPEDKKPYWSLKCTEHPLDDPPFKGSLYGPRLSEKTICMVAQQNSATKNYSHYDVHSLYGWSQTEPTLKALQNVTLMRGIVISRSTYPSSGTMAGTWLGDNDSSWEHLRESIIGMLEHNLFGIPFVGADICGYFGDATPELCQRWMQLGAFYPYSRNHNGKDNREQDPASFGEKVAASSKKALEVRYTLLPYLYTLFYRAHTQGETVVRSLVHEFPSDNETASIDRQFLWGGHILITPVVESGAISVEGYFPDYEERWFNYYDGTEEDTLGCKVLDAPMDHIPVHVRGGVILPTQEPANSTFYSRQKPFGLIIAPDSENMSSGSLFWDDGDSIDSITSNNYAEYSFTYSMHESGANITISQLNKKSTFDFDFEMPELGSIRLFGVEERPNNITYIGDSDDIIFPTFEYKADTKEVLVKDMAIRLTGDEDVFIHIN